MIPEEDEEAMIEWYFGEDPLEKEMRENGVSWSDFFAG